MGRRRGDWVRKLARPSWLPHDASWPRRGHSPGLPVKGFNPLNGRCALAIVGEGPGKDESVYGYPLVGASGQETDRHLDRIGLDRAEVLATNVTWQVPEAKGKLGGANPQLAAELAAARPEVIFALGRHAARHFLGDVDMEVAHGLAFHVEQPWGETTIVAGYHPAAGMHNVELSGAVAYDFDILRAVIAGEIEPRRGVLDDPYPNPCYLEHTDRQQWMLMAGEWTAGCAIDTEGSESAPWCLSYATTPGEAWVIRQRTLVWLEAFREALVWATAKVDGFHVWLHNSLHDLPVLRALGIDLVDLGVPFLDTMVLAYQLGVEPQGLKPLGVRHASAHQNSYLDTIGPFTHEKALRYLARVAADDTLPTRDLWGEEVIEDYELKFKTHKPTPIWKRALKILDDVASEKVNKDGELTDPFARWRQIEPEDRAMAEGRYGVLQAATLDEVPLATVIAYAARDADITLRIGPALLARHQAVFGASA